MDDYKVIYRVLCDGGMRNRFPSRRSTGPQPLRRTDGATVALDELEFCIRNVIASVVGREQPKSFSFDEFDEHIFLERNRVMARIVVVIANYDQGEKNFSELVEVPDGMDGQYVEKLYVMYCELAELDDFVDWLARFGIRKVEHDLAEIDVPGQQAGAMSPP